MHAHDGRTTHESEGANEVLSGSSESRRESQLYAVLPLVNINLCPLGVINHNHGYNSFQ